MPENDPDNSNEKLLILPLNEESKKITQIISNDTARQIIDLLADAPLSASDIAERLKAPLTTIVYNLENLEKVGLVKIDRIKYSEKGRKVKIYAPVRKLIVVVPEKIDKKSVADILRKYMGVLLAAIFASGAIEFLMGRSGRRDYEMQAASDAGNALIPGQVMPSPAATTLDEALINVTRKSVEEGVVAVPAASPAATSAPAAEELYDALNITPTPPPFLESDTMSRAAPDIFTRISDTVISHPGLVFFLGCLFVVLVIAILDYRNKKKDD